MDFYSKNPKILPRSELPMPSAQPPKKTSGSGRPHVWSEPTVKVALQLPEDLAKRLRTRAVHEGVSVSRLVGDWVVQREMEERIALGEADIASGRVHTWEEFKAELDKWR
jgi:predicted transcriptional regulator